MNYLIDVWGKHASLYLQDMWNSVFFWRSVSLILITIIVGVFYFRNKIKDFYLKKDYRAHDQSIFKRIDKYVSERELIDCCRRLRGEMSLDGNAIYKIGEILDIYEEEGNKYINKKLARKFDGFIYYLNELNDFMALHFFTHNNIESWYTLEPELKKYNNTIANYKKFSDDLDNKVKIVIDKYKQYRIATRKILNI